MDKKSTGLLLISFALCFASYGQVDTAYIYNPSTPYGGLDLRIAKSATNYYYLQEDKTFSFRGTDTYLDMTQWDSGPYRQGNLREKTTSGDNFVMNYRLLVPQGYNATFAEGYPLIVVLHGLGERGNCNEKGECYHADAAYSPVTNSPPAPRDPGHELLNNDHSLLHGGRPHLIASDKAGTKLPGDPGLAERAFPGFVLFPQNLNGWDQFATQDAIRIVRLLMKKYRINPDKIYVEGISNGGHGMYEAIKRAPWLFAAALGMSAIDDGFINAQGLAPKIAHIPLWLFQGGLDVNPYPSKTQRYIQQFRNAGADVRYTLYPELAHGTWNRAFAEPDFFSWMLGKSKADLHSFENSTVICSPEGTLLEVGEGFLAYQWQKDGQTIPGATTSTYYAKTPGSYRVRFARVSNPTESQWNEWSNTLALKTGSPPKADLQQIGTVHLRDLNNYGDARLKSVTQHDQYFWYKDGILLDLPGTQDDSMKVATIAPTYGKGAYTLVVSDQGCKSAPSAPRHVFFNNQSPLSITAPSGLAGTSSSASTVRLTWKDGSANEGGFEVWRRKKNGESSFGPWEMPGLTAANATSFDDTGLEPATTYQYRIRAVSSTARSPYFPVETAAAVSVQTVVDTQRPTAPANLKVVPGGIQTLRLSWTPSKDNALVKYYTIYYNTDSVSTLTADTTFVLTNLPLNRNYDIRVRGVDFSKNFSAPSNTVKASTYYAGLFYTHSTGAWDNLATIDWSKPEYTGQVPVFTLSPKTQDDYFNFSFDGFVYIEGSGQYQFRTSSDDGSRLMLNGSVLVNNDGVHTLKTVTSAATALQAGPQRIRVEFFDVTLSDSLLVEYKGPDTQGQWKQIPREVIKSDESVVTALGPDNGPEDSFEVNVYPNPASQDNIHVQVGTVIAEEHVQVRLVDPVGRGIFEGTFGAEEIAQGVRISPEGVLSNGLYVVMVRQGKMLVRRKLVIRR